MATALPSEKGQPDVGSVRDEPLSPDCADTQPLWLMTGVLPAFGTVAGTTVSSPQ